MRDRTLPNERSSRVGFSFSIEHLPSDPEARGPSARLRLSRRFSCAPRSIAPGTTSEVLLPWVIDAAVQERNEETIRIEGYCLDGKAPSFHPGGTSRRMKTNR